MFHLSILKKICNPLYLQISKLSRNLFTLASYNGNHRNVAENFTIGHHEERAFASFSNIHGNDIRPGQYLKCLLAEDEG